jgi:hypothetical protein
MTAIGASYAAWSYLDCGIFDYCVGMCVEAEVVAVVDV